MPNSEEFEKRITALYGKFKDQQWGISGHIYLAYLYRDLYKVGKSTNLESRFKQYRSVIPFMDRRAVIPVDNLDQVEQAVLLELKEKKLSGRGKEWFILTDKEVHEFCLMVQEINRIFILLRSQEHYWKTADSILDELERLIPLEYDSDDGTDWDWLNEDEREERRQRNEENSRNHVLFWTIYSKTMREIYG